MTGNTIQTLTVIYAAVLHLASLVLVGVLLAIGAIPSDVGVPLFSGLAGVGVGAGGALIVPGLINSPTTTTPAPPSLP